jgi:hypothetical protein
MHAREWKVGGTVPKLLSEKTLKASSFGGGDPVEKLAAALKQDLITDASAKQVSAHLMLGAIEPVWVEVTPFSVGG